MIPLGIRRYLAFGTGAGIEIGPRHLTATIVRMRPSGASVLGTWVKEDFRDHPAADWGREYAAFLKQHGAAHVAAVVLLPRREVIVRTVAFPGVKDEELGNAVRYQADSLHPYDEDDAVLGWSRLDGAHIVAGVARKQIFDRYQSLFSEAGVQVASFTFSAAVLRSALRMVDQPPRDLLTGIETGEGLEIYGESEGKPLYSAVFESGADRAFALARAELRLPPDAEAREMGVSLSQAAAMSSACPALAVDANLLPETERRSSSKLRYIPTALLALILSGLCAAILLHEPYDERVYRAALESALAETEPLSSRVGNLDKNLATTRAKVGDLDRFRQRTKADLDLILELTNTLAPPASLAAMDLTRDTVTLSGEADQAAPLLRLFDGSARLSASEFITPIGRVGSVEVFRIRSRREAPPAVAPVPSASTAGAPTPPPPVTVAAPFPAGGAR